MTVRRSPNEAFAIALALVALTCAAYWQAPFHDFLNYDDDEYVTESPRTLDGLNMESVKWAFWEPITGNWHPLTRISHMVGVSLFGVNPAGHHAMNVGLHAANVLLLFFVLRGMTGATGRCAIVAALFAVHTLHVESVAWVSARKDVLSTFFWLAAIGCYAYYSKAPAIRRYIPLLAFAMFGLMSKPMVVTLPVTLLLLDAWPLKRFRLSTPRETLRCAGLLIAEKIPLFAASIGVSITTFLWQRQVGVVGDIARFSIWERLSNSLIAYVTHLRRLVVPHDLALIYPYPKEPASPLIVAFAAAFLALATVIALRAFRSRPYLIVGWTWYLLTLLPVIGLIQVGTQAMADRYTYVPMWGIYIAIVWGVADIFARTNASRWLPRAIAAVTVICLTGVTMRQNAYWKDSISILERTIAVTQDNVTAHWFLSEAYGYLGDDRNSALHLYEAMRLEGEADPSTDSVEKFYMIGNAALVLEKWDDAEHFFERALEFDAQHRPTMNELAEVYVAKGRAGDDEYIRRAHLLVRQILNANPNDLDALSHAASLALHEKNYESARQTYARLIDANQNVPDWHRNIALAFEGLGEYEKAIEHAQRALALNPNFEQAREDLARYTENRDGV